MAPSSSSSTAAWIWAAVAFNSDAMVEMMFMVKVLKLKKREKDSGFGEVWQRKRPSENRVLQEWHRCFRRP
ncbi:hypothetical protein l11_00220 [Neisseria weaveri LMG 5135]|nr:hypothetical protein l11_00220 [Neisseria weaveri LMG 5135]